MTQVRYVLKRENGTFLLAIGGKYRFYTADPWSAFYRTTQEAVWYYRDKFATGSDKEAAVRIERDI